MIPKSKYGYTRHHNAAANNHLDVYKSIMENIEDKNCDKEFNLSRNLKKHEKIKYDEKSYS